MKSSFAISSLPSHRTSKVHDRYRIQSVTRALTILQTLSESDSELGAAQIGKQMRVGLTTTFRMLMTLQAQGFVERNLANGKYRLGLSCLKLGSRYIQGNDIRGCALKEMNSLRDEFGETVHLAILEGNRVIYLEKLNGLHPIGFMSSRVGGSAPAYCTGIGKVLLAYLDEQDLCSRYAGVKLHRFTPSTITSMDALLAELARIRDQGYAVDHEEHEPDVMCCAVPIWERSGVIAALSIAGPSQRMSHHFEVEDLVGKSIKAGNEISLRMGASQLANQPNGTDLASSRSRKKKKKR